MKRIMIMAAVASLLVCCVPAGAEVFLLHEGLNDPLTEGGWTFDDFNTGVNDPQQHGSATGGTDTEDYWRIQREAPAAGRYLGVLDAGKMGQPDGWTLTARVKVNDAWWVSMCEIGVLDSTSWWAINLCADEYGYMGAYAYNKSLGFGPQLASLDPSADYHTYQIIYNPRLGIDGVMYVIDDVIVGSQTRSDVSIGYGLYRVQWGSGGSVDVDTQWSYVKWETGSFMPPVGDATLDGIVNADDAARLAENWLKTGGSDWTMGDFNNDDKVDDIDAALMAANWGYGNGGGTASVPEPSTIAGLLVLSTLFVLAKRRQRPKQA